MASLNCFSAIMVDFLRHNTVVEASLNTVHGDVLRFFVYFYVFASFVPHLPFHRPRRRCCSNWQRESAH